MQDENAFISLLHSADVLIGYSPLKDEPDFRVYFRTNKVLQNVEHVPSTEETNPFALAEQFVETYAGKVVIVLAPGRAFDLQGTRHGRGGGWYDRFLSRIPKTWVRVGVADSRQVHDEKLERNEWDEVVDYVLVEDAGLWSAHKVGNRLEEK